MPTCITHGVNYGELVCHRTEKGATNRLRAGEFRIRPTGICSLSSEFTFGSSSVDIFERRFSWYAVTCSSSAL